MPSPSSTPPPSGRFARALLALGLLVGFYALAIGIAAALLLLPYLELRDGNRLHLQVAVVSLLGAAAILIAIVPRPQKFKAPGSLLVRERQPRLFALIDEVAAATGQATPKEVYLVPQVNAWVAERGGILGVGGTRIMGVGLPVFSALTIPEFRAVLAHEFGHYAGGDTRLGGVIHVTRAAIGRTLVNLKVDEERATLLQKPFIAYGNMFLRVTLSLSREQERSADALAATLEGPAALGAGLRKLHVLDSVFDSYLDNEINPALRSQLLPPITEGLVRFLRAPAVREQYAAALERVVDLSRRAAEVKKVGLARYESHPSLHERIEALALPPAPHVPGDEAAAVTLVDGWPGLERDLMALMNDAPPLPSITWDEMAEKVFLARQVEELQPLRDELAEFTIEDAGRDVEALSRRALRVWARETEGARAKMDPATYEARGVGLLGAAVAVTLNGLGWSAQTQPGDPILLRRDDRSIDPMTELRDRFEGRAEAEAWVRRCAELGIGDQKITIPKLAEAPASTQGGS